MNRLQTLAFSTARRSYVTVFLATAVVYFLTAHYTSGQVNDTEAAIWPAYEFVHHGTFRLDHVKGLPSNIWFWHHNGHIVSTRMMGPILAGVPVSALLAWSHLSPAALNSLSSALMTTIAMTALFAAFRRLVPGRAALCAIIVVAFGTPVWTVASSETWPQTVDVLFLSLMILALTRNRIGWAGIALAPALTSRPHLALIALVLGVGLSVGRRSWRPLFAFGVPAGVAFAVLYPWNYYQYGQWQLLGTYSSKIAVLNDQKMTLQHWAYGGLQGAFSPMQGFLLFSPVLLLAIVWIVRGPRHAPGWAGLLLIAGLLYQGLQWRLDAWDGGGGFYGSRLTLELIVLASPIAVSCYQPWAAGHPGRRFLASVLAGIGVVIFSIGGLLSSFRIGGAYNSFWTTFYPQQVVVFAGYKGAVTVVVAMVILLAFLAVQYQACFQRRTFEAAAGIVAPRDPSELETIGAAQPLIGVNGAFLLAPITGVQRFAYQLLLGLLEARPGLAVRVYVPPLPEDRQPLLEQLRAAGAEIVVGPSWARDKQVFEQLGLALMAHRDEVSCVVQLNNNVSFLRRKPQVCFVYDLAPLRIPGTYRFAYRFKFWATIAGIKRRKPRVVTLSEFSRSELESVGVRVTAVVPGGTGSPMLLAAQPAPSSLPEMDGPYALVFGSADPRKRVEEVIAAWPPVYAALGLKLAVVQGVAPTHRASGPAAPSTDGVLRLSGRVTDDELVRLVRGARLAVFASRYEGGALAAQEVLALGTPVVASDIPTFSELLAPPVAFFREFAELADACRRVLDAGRPTASTLAETHEGWRLAGEALAKVAAGASGQRSAVPVQQDQRETARG